MICITLSSPETSHIQYTRLPPPEVLLYSFLTLAVDIGECITPCHTPATLPPGNKEVLMEWEAECAPELVWMFWRRESLLAPTKI